jgi:cytochrome c oxidase subunit 3
MDALVSPETREPARSTPLVPSGVMGMLLFVFTECMLFAGFISAHAIVKAGATEWPPANQPTLPFATTMLNTAALLASGVFLLAAHFSYRRHRESAKLPMFLAMVLGGFFVVAQGREWVVLLREGLTLTSSPYGSFFYLIIGLHALHAVAAILGLAWAWTRLRSSRLEPTQLWTVEAFWYFVVLVWPLIYFRVYL